MSDIEKRAHDIAIILLFEKLHNEEDKLEYNDIVDLYSDVYFGILKELKDTRDF